ncbi:MAG: hypothetical protein MJE77_32490 [Proteobacteria bacterium]|nr:hypothetical protein [Pseudomonadota bacterium]
MTDRESGRGEQNQRDGNDEPADGVAVPPAASEPTDDDGWGDAAHAAGGENARPATDDDHWSDVASQAAAASRHDHGETSAEQSPSTTEQAIEQAAGPSTEQAAGPSTELSGASVPERSSDWAIDDERRSDRWSDVELDTVGEDESGPDAKAESAADPTNTAVQAAGQSTAAGPGGPSTVAEASGQSTGATVSGELDGSQVDDRSTVAQRREPDGRVSPAAASREGRVSSAAASRENQISSAAVGADSTDSRGDTSPAAGRQTKARKSDSRRSDSGSRRGGSGGRNKQPRNWRRALVLFALTAIAALIAAALIAGSTNSELYYLVCRTKKADKDDSAPVKVLAAEKGDFFPPWGRSQLSGPEWKPIEAACGETKKFASAAELAGVFRQELYNMAKTRLDEWATKWLDAQKTVDSWTRVTEIRATRRHFSEGIEVIEAWVDQALLLGRGSDQASQGFTYKADQLLSYVRFWQGQAAVQSAISSLTAARDGFAQAQKHMSTDALDWGTWRDYVDRLRSELGKGPPPLRLQSESHESPGPLTTPPGPSASADKSESESGKQHVDNSSGAGPDAGPGSLLPPPGEAAGPASKSDGPADGPLI